MFENFVEKGASFRFSTDVPIISDCDVLVVGAGVAGISAAVASARNNARTLLIERDGCVGGTATTGLMVVFMGVSPNTIKGNCKELLKRLETAGGAFISGNTPFDPEIFKQVAETWLVENHVNLLYHATFVSTIVQDGKAIGVLLHLKEGLRIVLCKVLIDASGDADAAASAGVPFQKTDHLQPMTSVFRMDRVDTPRLMRFIKNNPKQFFSQRGQITWEEQHDPPFFTLGGFFDLIELARANGDLELPHDSIWLGPLPRSGQYFINATRISGLNGSYSSDLSKAELILRKQAWDVSRFLVANVPGFENAHMLDIAVRVGVRETRKILGQYVLTGNDLRNSVRFDDAVVTYDFPMDIHGAAGNEESHEWGLFDGQYDIPYRSLIPKNIDNLLVAGRCISSDSQAHGSTRSMPCCIATGEAAGVAAAIASTCGEIVSKIDYSHLRNLLLDQGVNLR